MAFYRDLLPPLTDPLLKSPDQAASVFGLNGRHPPRQKHLFIVHFVRETQSDDANWRDNLSYVVKAIDRPSIQPVVEEINQYNRKRLIHTGVKYQPINCTFYDTADGAAMNMWMQYARYYFGDYSQDHKGYTDDIINAELSDPTAGTGQPAGFGFNIRQGAVNDGTGSQHFFSKVVVYQVWGNEYTSFELLNPRINSFTPDDLAYDNSEVSTIQISLSFEAIHHGNTGRPQDLLSETVLTELFEDGFHGQTIEVSGHSKKVGFVSSAISVTNPHLTPSMDYLSGGGEMEMPRTTTSSEGGVLNRFGVYDFGSGQPGLADPIFNSASQALGGSQSLANLMSGNFSGGVSNYRTDLNRASDGVQAAVGNDALRIPGMARGINAASIRTGESAYDQADRSNGLVLSNAATAAFNEVKDGTFLVGFNKPINSPNG
jgi:hypothetical protein